MEELNSSSWVWELRYDEQQAVSHLFMAHPLSIAMLRRYPQVLILDCTYNTNRFNMPLLVIGGITSLGTTFYAAFAFLLGEKTEDYTWALGEMAKLYGDIGAPQGPKTTVTDREMALANAIRAVWPLEKRFW